MGQVPEMDCSFFLFFFTDLILILDCEHKTSHGKRCFSFGLWCCFLGGVCVCVCVCVSVLIFVFPEATQSQR